MRSWIGRLLLLSACLTALLLIPVFFLVGIMATDSGTSFAIALGRFIAVLGICLAGFVLWACFRYWPSGSAKASFFSKVIVGSVYLIGSAGPVFGIKLLIDRVLETPRQSVEVVSSEAAFPSINPASNWSIQINGALPEDVPLDHFEVQYITDTGEPDSIALECKRTEKEGSYPLRHTESVDITRDGTVYAVSVIADKFLPGKCNWHLSEITPRLTGNGADVQAGSILTGPKPTIGASGSSVNRIDLWCRRFPAPDDRKTICAEFPQSAVLDKSVPAEERLPLHALYADPESRAFTINFHDVGSPAVRSHSAASTP